MSSYNVGNNFSFDKGKIAYNGEKNKTFDLTKFDGVAEDELLNKDGVTTNQKALLTSIFNKYDTNGDGGLTPEEFSQMQNDLTKIAKDGNLGNGELKKFNKNLGADSKAYTMEDLQSVVGMMVDGTDRVTGVKTEGDKITVSFNPDMANGITEQVFQNKVLLSQTQNRNEKITLSTPVEGERYDIENPVEVTTFADDGKTPVKSVIKDKNGNPNSPVLTTIYNNDGIFKSQTCTTTTKEGTVTLNYDNRGKVNSKTVKAPDNTEVTAKYSYNEAGNLTEVQEGDNKVITYDGTGNRVVNITKITEKSKDEGSKETVTKVTNYNSGEFSSSTRTTKNDKDKLVGYVELNENGEVQDFVQKVEVGQTWYNIVKAKYGVTDHKTIMEIVHKLKDNANVSYSSAKMPKEITLPATITLSNNDTVNLKNTGALVSIEDVIDKNGNQVGPSITPPANLTAEQMPPQIGPLPEDQRKITIPTFEVNTANARKTVKQSDEKYYRYDSAGRVRYIYDTEADKDAGRERIDIMYYSDNSIHYYTQHTYDEQERKTGLNEYDGNGELTSSNRYIYDKFDENNPEQYGRQTVYNTDGSIGSIRDNVKYDEQGREVSYDDFKPDGSWDCSGRFDYGNDGSSQFRFYNHNENGKISSIFSD
jgi:hypothetical protein